MLPVRSSLLHQSEWKSYLPKVLKQVQPGTRVTKRVIHQVNFILNAIGNELSASANQLRIRASSKTLSTRDLNFAAQLVIKGELGKHARSEATKALTKFNSSAKDGNKAKKAGLLFPPSRGEAMLRAHCSARVGKHAGISLAAMLEYLAAEMFELAGNAAKSDGFKKQELLNPRHMILAIRNDEELNTLFNVLDLDIVGGGVLPKIHAVLLPKRK